MDDKETSYAVMSKKEINSYRHKAERRWYRRLVTINIMVIVFAILFSLVSMEKNKKYFEELKNDFNNVTSEVMKEIEDESIESSNINTEENTELNADSTSYDDYSDSDSAAEDKLMKTIEKFPEDIKFLAMIMGALIFLPIAVSYLYAKYRSMSIKVTENNFPEIYEIVEEYTIRLGLKKMPNVYIVQGNGVLNAFASFIPFKQYIELYADLVEVAYREYNDLDSLRFIIGHEMAHIRLKHATMHYSLLIMFANYIPLISSTASRAREYSCDRIAQHLSGSDGIDAIMSLTAGIHLYKRVNKEDYIKNARKEKGFFVWCYNLAASHPVTTKRVLALEMKEGSGKLY